MSIFDTVFDRRDEPRVTLETDPPAGTYIRAELEGDNALCGWVESPDGTWIAVYTCSSPHRVALLEDSTGQFMIELNQPSALALSDTGRLAVVEPHGDGKTGGTFWVFDSSGAVLIERSTTEGSVDCAIDASGRYAALAGTEAVDVIDVTADTDLGTVDTPVQAPGVGFDSVAEDLALLVYEGPDETELLEMIRVEPLKQDQPTRVDG